MTREYNKQWKRFVEKSERGYITFALRSTRHLEDAQDIVYSAYGRLCQKDYSFEDMGKIGITVIQRGLINRAKNSKLQKNAAHVMYIEDLAMFEPRDTYTDIETSLELKLLGIEVTESLISTEPKKKNGANWPYIDRFIGF